MQSHAGILNVCYSSIDPMSGPSVTAKALSTSEQNLAQSEAVAVPRQRMSTLQRLLFFLTAWLIVLMPFLFWWNTWFGRPLSDKQLAEYLNDEKHPRHIQHALIQIGERMG